jgi:hypothetical protein
MAGSLPIEREFAGEIWRFQLPPANPTRLYRGIEGEGIGNLSELAMRARNGTLSARAVECIIAHALSQGHPITLMRMRDVVHDEMAGKPLAEFIPLALEIVLAAYAGLEDAA